MKKYLPILIIFLFSQTLLGKDNFLKDCQNFISKNEGIRNKVYLDTKKIPTIGIGFNLTRTDAKKILNKLGYDYDKVLSGKSLLKNEDILSIFNIDLINTINNAQKIVTNFNTLPDLAKLVIVDMIFNLGPNKFSNFKNTIKAFENNDFETAAKEMTNSQWFKQVGNRSKSNVNIIRNLNNGEKNAKANNK